MSGDKKGLTTLNLVMLSLGTVVGGSFFLGSAVAIRAAGPAIIVAFIIGGLLMYFILTALSEMTVANPSTGSFRDYAETNFGPLLGFVVGWIYWTGLALGMSSEATAVSIFLREWLPGVPLGVIAAAIVVVVTVLNLVGASLFSRLEGSLAGVKLLALFGFLAIGIFLIAGLLPGRPVLGAGALMGEAFAPRGLAGIAGSMLIVMFSYAGFEVVGLAAPEARDHHRTVVRAVFYTVVVLVGLYLGVMFVLLPLIPTASLGPDASPLVAALNVHGLGAAARIFNVVMITAILSTMLASTFGLGRMIYALALKGHAPAWLKRMHTSQVPLRGILFSGLGMLAGVSLSFVLPKQVYLFLVASGGYSTLFAYAVIMITHYRYRRANGCPPIGQCQLPGFPYTSLITLVAIVVIIASMPLIPGQGAGLAAGLLLTAFYIAAFYIYKFRVPARSLRFRGMSAKPVAGGRNEDRSRDEDNWKKE